MMRPTPPLAGIKGIFPIIKRHAPNAISYPSRFSGVANTRIAIDATLLLQRLHFSPDPHPSRHILGLLRLLRTLRSHSIRPIIVFDNPDPAGRLPQKERERQKRSRARDVIRYRSEAERRRGVRLRLLRELVEGLRECTGEERREVARLLKGWKEAEGDQHVLGQQSTSNLVEVEDWIERALEQEEGEQEMVPIDAMGDGVSDLDEGVPIEADQSQVSLDLLAWSQTPKSPSPSPWSAPAKQEDDDSWDHIVEAESGRPFYLALRLHQLRSSFERSTMPQALDDVLGDGSARELSSGEGDVENVAQLGETAQQAQLTAMESEAYDVLASPNQDPIEALEELERRQEQRGKVTQVVLEGEAVDVLPLETDETMDLAPSRPPASPLTQIVSHHATLSSAYARRVSPLPLTLLSESAELCTLLNVPVLWTGAGGREGGRPHEAEALCSSLVRNGWADMVASEDSDVLLYGAKLLRNLVGTKKELELVDPVEVRRALFGRKSGRGASMGVGKEEGLEGQLSTPPSLDDGAQESEERKSEEEDGEEEARTQRMLLDFALLCGTDFNRTIPGIASNKALDLIRRHGDISSMISATTTSPTSAPSTRPIKPPPGLSWKEFSRELQSARDVFQKPPSLKWYVAQLRRFGLEGEEKRERKIRELAERMERERWVRRRRRQEGRGKVEKKAKGTAGDDGQKGEGMGNEGVDLGPLSSAKETEAERQAWIDAYSARLRRRREAQSMGMESMSGQEAMEKTQRTRESLLRDFLKRCAGVGEEEMERESEWEVEGIGLEGVGGGGGMNGREAETGSEGDGDGDSKRKEHGQSSFGKAPFDDAEVTSDGERRKEGAVWTP